MQGTQEPGILKAVVASSGRITLGVANDDMIEEFDSEDMGGFFELAGDADVFPARRRIAGWVVVENDAGGGGSQNRKLEHFASVNKATAGGPKVTMLLPIGLFFRLRAITQNDSCMGFSSKAPFM